MRSRFGWLAVALAVGGCGSADSGTPAGNTPVTPGFNQPQPGVPPAQTPGPTNVPTPGVGDQPVAGNGPTAPVDNPVTPVVNMPGDDMQNPGPGPTPSGDCAMSGLQLEGLMYSPGGTVLPHPCEPFHPTTNNPYAVRCIDVWDFYKTDYPGDDLCILPPEPGKGIQFGVHPQGTDWYAQVSTGDLSGYQNIPSDFIMRPGEEEERNYKTSIPTTEPKNYYRSYMRMRSGSHHSIVSGNAGSGPASESWGPGSPDGLFGGTPLPGGQRVDMNIPDTLEKPAEDKGLYQKLPPSQHVTLDMHHFNATDGDILKEVWTNLWFEDDATIEVFGMFGMPLTQAIATFAQPGQTVDMHYFWSITQDIRIVNLYGHSHAWTSNFSAWIQKPDGSNDVVYQSFDWFDKPTYRYDSITQNPPTMPGSTQDGAHSGVLTVKAGEQLHFNCHMEFTPERASAVDGPMPSSIGPLRFANQAFQGEMCILFGSTAGRSIGQPAAALTPVPDFATVD